VRESRRGVKVGAVVKRSLSGRHVVKSSNKATMRESGEGGSVVIMS
jgi:hypothetical protein